MTNLRYDAQMSSAGSNVLIIKMISSDLKPGTWYSLQLTAHNGAGSRVVTTQFATLSLTGDDGHHHYHNDDDNEDASDIVDGDTSSIPVILFAVLR